MVDIQWETEREELVYKMGAQKVFGGEVRRVLYSESPPASGGKKKIAKEKGGKRNSTDYKKKLSSLLYVSALRN